MNILDSVKKHPDFESKYQNNTDPINCEQAFEKIMRKVMLARRKDELELYKLFANDPVFKASWMQSAQRMMGM
ncbi:hypothetical protein C3Y05_018015 [Aeromonas allosaccharophila]|uniref:hypothetical protein n=1 Tax=Aeromonas allosaccharophila TaxID=656 RepID=UPI001F07B6B4|nr:hypothetical protein [Aeromonas allosaccharophila]WDO01512.1 hypothetical protein C3Y05_018015 [Aeromonas allosaccharophila]